jgi:autotransporter-associated beta strand protein
VSTSTSAGGASVTLTASSSGTITEAGTNTTITGNGLALTAGGGIGSSTNPIIMNGTTLTADSSAGNSSQWLEDTATIGLNSSNALVANTGTNHSGVINLVSGTFQIQGGAGGNAIADNSPVVVTSPALLDLNGNNETVFSLAGSGSVTLGSGTLTTGNSTGDSPTFSGVISGTGGVTKIGTDSWTLTGANTYTGATNLNGGTLTVGSTGVINNGTAATGGVVNLNTAGVTLNGSGTIYGQVTIDASSSASPTVIQAVTISIPTTSGGTGISVVPGARFVQIGVTGGGVTVNRLTAAGNTGTTGIDVQGSARIENSTIGGASSSVGHHLGIVVDGGGTGAVGGLDGVAALQNDQINNDTAGTATSGATGLYVEHSGIVDAGQIAASFTAPPSPNGYYGDITGLLGGGTNHSTGFNSFSGYTPMPSNADLGSPQAIRDENTGIASFARAGVELSNNYSAVGPQLGRMDVTAQNNTWGGATTNQAIENLIYHDVDNPNLGFVSYGVSTQNPNVVGTPQYSASFDSRLTAVQQGTDNLVSGTQPTGTGHQKSVIRYFKVVFDSFVFLDPNLKTPTTNLGLTLYQLNSPYGPAGNSPGSPVLITAKLFSALYNESNGQYSVIYSFTGPGTEYGSLQDGNYSLQFNEAGIQGGGPGGPSLTTNISGNPYVNAAAQFFRLFGDSLGRGQVDDTDLTAFRQANTPSRIGMANYRAWFDFDGNGVVDSSDYYQFMRRYKTKLNPDGTISIIP